MISRERVRFSLPRHSPVDATHLNLQLPAPPVSHPVLHAAGAHGSGALRLRREGTGWLQSASGNVTGSGGVAARRGRF